MKKLLVFCVFAILAVSNVKAQSSMTGCPDLFMNRKVANYFASAAGYNGQGALPNLSASVFEDMMTDDLADYFENSVPMCESCYSSRSYSSLAVCNARLQYFNLYTYDQNQIIRNMEYVKSTFRTRN